ncbi:metallophosphoesterase family protein [Roseateles violae]|uniref:Metallophosphoesterase family protein n=1 Tax=Roseateles violae TaxID=3058042 RepID=A0ABT8DL83_9BURK|nr:metallophosphoesterase family protein [Pelomonas sp. PFR6]MDN3919181.1 metallophosphoesterase family protein [Pelomonas sp. PFR6]
MRIALLSDIHGNLPALEAVVADIARRGGVERIVNLGDSLSGPLLPLETARYLIDKGWLSLAGNHERQVLEVHAGRAGGASDTYAHGCLGEPELDWLRLQRPALRLDDEVLLCHGTPRSDCEYFLDSHDPAAGWALGLATADEVDARCAGEAAAVIACGHTHVARALRSRAGQLLVNPGSVGLQAWQSELPAPHGIETGSPDARYAIIERSADGCWHAELIAVPYDFAPMAALARRNSRPEWERALLTGYIR